jgi:hypothetical protein
MSLKFMRFFQVIFGSSVDFQTQPTDFINRRGLVLKVLDLCFIGDCLVF